VSPGFQVIFSEIMASIIVLFCLDCTYRRKQNCRQLSSARRISKRFIK